MSSPVDSAPQTLSRSLSPAEADVESTGPSRGFNTAPVRDLKQTRDNWNAVLASTIGWTLDSFDYFVVVMVLTEIAKEFHRTNAEVALTITLTLAMRPVGAFLFGLMADRYGRRIPLMIDVVAFSVLSVASGLAPSYRSFVIVRVLFGIAMGGEWGAGASLVMEKVAPK